MIARLIGRSEAGRENPLDVTLRRLAGRNGGSLEGFQIDSIMGEEERCIVQSHTASQARPFATQKASWTQMVRTVLDRSKAPASLYLENRLPSSPGLAGGV